MRVTWVFLKSLLVSKNTTVIDWADLGDYYLISWQDGPFRLEVIIKKTSSASSDQIDFEANYKDAGIERYPALMPLLPYEAQDV